MPDKNFVIIALGSNLGDRAANLKAGITELNRQIHDIVISPTYQTSALLPKNAPASWDSYFYNCVISGQTSLKPQELLDFCNSIETSISPEIRQKGSSGPRYLDIDILGYNNDVIDLPNIKIPHPAMLQRNFVTYPLNDILPDWIHPITGQKISIHKNSLPPLDIKKL